MELSHPILDFFNSTELSIPVIQVAMLLIVSTLSLLFGRVKLALLTNYVFAFYWGYIQNREQLFGTSLEKMNYFNMLYFGFGLVIVVLAMIGFMAQSDKKV